MDYNIQSIETVYKDNHFRSRNEATWAAFFDLIGWSWEYEPIDLNGWIPDFSIRQKDNSSILAEVKPIIDWHNWKENQDIRKILKKMETASNGLTNELLLLGSSISEHDDSWILSIGLIGERYKEEQRNSVWWQSAQLCAKNVYGLGFVPEHGSWKPRISGAPYDGDNCGFIGREQGKKYLSLFGDAKKKTRWEK